MGGGAPAGGCLHGPGTVVGGVRIQGGPDGQGTFAAIQPPDQRADELRGRLDDLLTQATGTLAELRIAARRGRLADLPELAEPLPEVAEELDDFAEAHG
jgi:hypothetical protein